MVRVDVADEALRVERTVDALVNVYDDVVEKRRQGKGVMSICLRVLRLWLMCSIPMLIRKCMSIWFHLSYRLKSFPLPQLVRESCLSLLAYAIHPGVSHVLLMLI